MKRALRLRTLSILGVGLAVAGCTPKPTNSTVKIQLPSAAGVLAGKPRLAQSVGASSVAWGLADPTTAAEFSCYAIAVEIPEATESKKIQCTKSDGSVAFAPALIFGLFKAGESISLTIPTGPKRKISLIGFAASSPQACVAVTRLDRTLLSAPLIIGSTQKDLGPGENALVLEGRVTGATKFDDCAWSSTPVSATPTPTPTPPTNALLSITDGPTYDFGSQAVSSTTDHTFTVTNVGPQTATSMSSSSLSAAYSFVGGSFPGTGGTCGASLASAANCTVVVRFSPAGGGVENSSLDISYNDGVGAVSSSRAVTGTGVVPPAVITVTSPTSNGSYTAAQSITVTVAFTAVVDVTGTPRVQLETGATDRYANYVSGTGTTTLSFSYSIQPGDTSPDLEALSTNALTLNGGTINNSFGHAAVLTLPTLGGGSSLSGSKALVVDTAQTLTIPFTGGEATGYPASIEINGGAIRLVPNDLATFTSGSHSGTTFIAGNVQLTSVGSGVYTSPIYDAGASITWPTLNFTTVEPYGKKIMNDAGAYANGNFTAAGSLIAEWRFDEGAAWAGVANELLDTSGNGLHGVSSGTPTQIASMVVGSKAASFNGTNQYFSVANTAALNPAGAITLSAWVKPQSTSAGYIAGKYYTASTAGYALKFQSGLLYASIYAGGSPFTASTSASGMTDGNWHHVVMTYDLTNLRLYLDGNLASTTASTNPLSHTSLPLTIGRDNASTYFTGAVDEVSLFGSALSLADIQQLRRRQSSAIGFQVRSCSSPCSSENFVGPAGLTSGYFRDLSGGMPSFSLGGVVSPNRYFQYRAVPHSILATNLPEFSYVGPVFYAADQPAAVLTAAPSYVTIDSFTETLGGSSITYQLSGDNGTTWKYWNGSAWTSASTPGQANTGSVINANLGTYNAQVGPGTLRVKVIFTSTGMNQPALDNLVIGYH